MRGAKPWWKPGWIGWMLLPVAFALLVVLLTGYDLRYQIQKLVMNQFGVDAMMTFTVEVVMYGLGARYPGTGFGPIAMCAALLALKLDPRRHSWAYVFVAVYGLASPRLVFVILEYMQTFGCDSSYVWIITMICGGALYAVVLGYAFRSWFVLGLLLGAVLVTGVVDLLFLFETDRTGAVSPTSTIYLVSTWFGYGWYPVVAAILIGHAVWARMHTYEPWRCGKCGYDLRELDTGVCPECGASTAPTPNA